ncbi:hypothetical protein Q9966_015667 [Columba livia]|nr:hypothetical protein Q9966_015667 [Columba livia]
MMSQKVLLLRLAPPVTGGICRDILPSRHRWSHESLELWQDVQHRGMCHQGRRLRMGTEGLVSPQTLWLLLWVQLFRGPADSASLWLVGGGSWCDGRVEIFQRGMWGRVLDDQWDVREASVVCRQLRCGEAEKAYSPPKPERGTGPVGLRGVRCSGHEASLTLCETSLPGSALLGGVVEDVGVICWGRHPEMPPEPLAPCPNSSSCTGSSTAQELFPEAVYEEIGHSPAWEKQARFGRSGSSSEQSLTQLQPYPGHREEEDGLASASDVPVLPGGDPVDGYDDAREVSLPGEDDAPGQGAREMPRVPEEGAGPSDAPRGGSLCSQRSVGVPGAEGDTASLSPGSMGYDDAEEISLAHL